MDATRTHRTPALVTLLALAACNIDYKVIEAEEGEGLVEAGEAGSGPPPASQGAGSIGDALGDGVGIAGEACTLGGACFKIAVTNIDKLDLLFVVDNSGSMAEEQAALRAQLPKLIRVLASGDREDGSPQQDFPPAKNMHLGVVSTDLGLPGIAGIDFCAGLGDEARLLHTASTDPSLVGCNAQGYPKFLTFNAMSDDPSQTALDFACISTLGTLGCGFEQPLESALKALWPANDQRIIFLRDPVTGFGEFGQGGYQVVGVVGGTGGSAGSTGTAGTAGTGDPLAPMQSGGPENAGFLRSDPLEGLSLLAIVMLTDEEDCSSQDMSHFRPPQYLDPNLPADQELAQQGLNVRCHFNAQNLFATQRYVEGLKALRPGNEPLVVFSAIVGVPPETVETVPASFGDPAARAAFYQRIREHALMQPQVLDMNTPGPEDDELRPSCDTAQGVAYPPHRILDVAEGFGENGIVQSICQDDFGPAVDRIVDRIGDQLGAVCLPQRLERRADGTVACKVIWRLPHPSRPVAGTPTECNALPFFVQALEGDRRTRDGEALCEVAQLAVLGGTTQPTLHDTNGDGELDGRDLRFDAGWYYDDFSAEVAQECRTEPEVRVAFTNGAMPPTGVTVYLDCEP